MHDDDIESRLRAAMQEATRPVTGTAIDQEEIHRTVARRQQLRKYGLAGLGGLAAAAALAAVVLIDPTGGEKVQTIRPAGESDTSVTLAPTTSTTTTESTSTTAAGLPEFPEQFGPLYFGTTTWGVYLLAGPLEPDAPEVEALIQPLVDAGYMPAGEGFAFMQPLSCDQGAPEALERDGMDNHVSVHFETEEQADQARAAFEARGTSVLGVVEVYHRCQEGD